MNERKAVKYHDRLVAALQEAMEALGEPDPHPYATLERERWARWADLLVEIAREP